MIIFFLIECGKFNDVVRDNMPLKLFCVFLAECYDVLFIFSEAW